MIMGTFGTLSCQRAPALSSQSIQRCDICATIPSAVHKRNEYLQIEGGKPSGRSAVRGGYSIPLLQRLGRPGTTHDDDPRRAPIARAAIQKRSARRGAPFHIRGRRAQARRWARQPYFG
ncbi:hypothetical protein MPC4_10138 [Methylocella tundrae]|uniref:Uncharacterized protein n=1 Tax=Methylocella tundrae TaxID=227605 RepID=A0A8B6M047_METTU|nr:hypothetical protein MPC1_2130005 [Methylocella tundrae]VTZ48188.1 hypothetical protein MPC4_10138 [Methylocella tundrae]